MPEGSVSEHQNYSLQVAAVAVVGGKLVRGVRSSMIVQLVGPEAEVVRQQNNEQEVCNNRSHRAQQMSALKPTSGNALSALLSRWSVGQFLDQYKNRSDRSPPPLLLLTLRHDETVIGALRKLSERGVLSAPVVAPDGDIFRGFFGVLDVVRELVTGKSVQLAMVRHQIGPEPGQPGADLLKLDASHWVDLTAEDQTIGAEQEGGGQRSFALADVLVGTQAPQSAARCCSSCCCSVVSLQQGRCLMRCPSLSSQRQPGKHNHRPSSLLQKGTAQAMMGICSFAPLTRASAKSASWTWLSRDSCMANPRHCAPFSFLVPLLVGTSCQGNNTAIIDLRAADLLHVFFQHATSVAVVCLPASFCFLVARYAQRLNEERIAPPPRPIDDFFNRLSPGRRLFHARRPCHRVAVCEWVRDDIVMGPRIDITDIISQSDVCRFLLNRQEELGPLAALSLAELGLVYIQDGNQTPRRATTGGVLHKRLWREEEEAVSSQKGSSAGTNTANACCCCFRVTMLLPSSVTCPACAAGG